MLGKKIVRMMLPLYVYLACLPPSSIRKADLTVSTETGVLLIIAFRKPFTPKNALQCWDQLA